MFRQQVPTAAPRRAPPACARGITHRLRELGAGATPARADRRATPLVIIARTKPSSRARLDQCTLRLQVGALFTLVAGDFPMASRFHAQTDRRQLLKAAFCAGLVIPGC